MNTMMMDPFNRFDTDVNGDPYSVYDVYCYNCESYHAPGEACMYSLLIAEIEGLL